MGRQWRRLGISHDSPDCLAARRGGILVGYANPGDMRRAGWKFIATDASGHLPFGLFGAAWTHCRVCIGAGDNRPTEPVGWFAVRRFVASGCARANTRHAERGPAEAA